jgi:hypothetical protein
MRRGRYRGATAMRRVSIGIALILVAAYSALFLYGFLQLRRARRLVKAVEELQVGAPVPQQRGAEFRNLRCIPDGGCYKSSSNLPFVDYFASPRGLPPRVALANWWGVMAVIRLDANGNVLEKGLGIDDGRYHQSLAVWLRVRKDARLFDPCNHPGVADHLGYLPYRVMRTGALEVDLSPDANQSLIRRAFDVRLECLNSVGGCKTPGDIAPAAWQDSVFHAEDSQEVFKNCNKRP